MLSPLILSNSVSMAQGDNRDLLIQSKLNSPLKTPMWIEEIIFSISSSSLQQNVSTNLWSALNYGGSVWVEITMDRAKMTNSFVPMWNFGKVLNEGLPSNGGFPYTDSVGVYAWKLPKPLWVEPDSNFRIAARRLGEGSIANLTVRATCIGHPVDSNCPRPKKICVPWVTPFVGVTRAAGTDFTDESLESQLVNPFDVPLKVQRLIGRIKGIDNSGNSPQEVSSTLGQSDPRIQSDWTLVRMFDQQGRIIVRDYTPFGLLFSQVDRSWTMDAELDPKGFYKVLLDEKYSNVGFTGKITPMISMVGYRELEF